MSIDICPSHLSILTGGRGLSPLQRIQTLATLQLQRAGYLHLLNIGEEPALGVLDHALARIDFMLAFVAQFGDIIHFHPLVQLSEFP